MTPSCDARPQDRVLTGPITIIDGDTIEQGGERLRLEGVDACESTQRYVIKGEERLCGPLATNWLRQETVNREVTCRGYERDRYNRLLVFCETDRGDIGARGVKAGVYVVYRTRRGHATVPRYEALETIAKGNKDGLWAGEFIAPREWRAQQRR